MPGEDMEKIRQGKRAGGCLEQYRGSHYFTERGGLSAKVTFDGALTKVSK